MNGIYFGEKHSYNDFGLILSSKTIATPAVKTNEIQIKGANGVLDLTETLTGRPTYKNRKLKFTFSVPDPENRWLITFSQVMNYLHGQNMKVILDEQPEYYYLGRISVNKIQSSKRIGTIVIDVNAAPFKYTVQSSEEDWKWDPFCFIDGYIQKTSYNVNGNLAVTINHHGEVTVPEFILSAPMQIAFGGVIYTVDKAGSYKNYEIFFENGENPITFTGTGHVDVKFKGGSL